MGDDFDFTQMHPEGAPGNLHQFFGDAGMKMFMASTSAGSHYTRAKASLFMTLSWIAGLAAIPGIVWLWQRVI